MIFLSIVGENGMHNRIPAHKCRRNLFFFAAWTVFLLSSCSKAERSLEFPFDHGPHFDSRTEWWYFTGEVLTSGGKTLGFEFTIFKAWNHRVNDFAFLGHVAVSDPENAEHFFAEEATSPPVAGIEEGKTEIQMDGFSYAFSEPEGITLKAEAGGLALDILLSPSMDVLPHGEDGIIEMGDGKNSYYYSFTNLLTAGKITVNGTEYSISSGRTWMDHQWGNYTLLGLLWDWFSLRLDNGGALMLFQFRNVFDNTVRANWTYRDASGTVQYGKDLFIQAARTYTVEQTDFTYPVDWTVEVAEIDASFQISPLFDGQVLYNVKTPDYWEGLCLAEGRIGAEPVSGSAYVELTGYRNRRMGGGLKHKMPEDLHTKGGPR